MLKDDIQPNHPGEPVAKRDSASYFKDGATAMDFEEVVSGSQHPVWVLIEDFSDSPKGKLPSEELWEKVEPVFGAIAQLDALEQELQIRALQKKLGGSKAISITALREKVKSFPKTGEGDPKEENRIGPPAKWGEPVAQQGNFKLYLFQEGIWAAKFQTADDGGGCSSLFQVSDFHLELTEEARLDPDEVDDSQNETKWMKGVVRGAGWEEPFSMAAADWNDDKSFKRAVAEAASDRARFIAKDIAPIRWVAGEISKDKVTRTVSGFVGTHPSGDFRTPTITVRKGEILKTASLGLVIRLDSGYTAASKVDLDAIRPADLKLAGNHIFEDLLDASERSVIRCLLGHAFLAPLYFSNAQLRSRTRPYLLLVVGPSGLGKTEACRLVLSFFGKFLTVEDLASWGNSSPKFNYDQASRVRGVPWLLDDLKRSKLPGGKLDHATQILHDIADGQGRGKAKPGTGAIAGVPVKAMVIVTMEDLPDFETALLARTLIVEHHGARDESKWEHCLGWQETYPAFTAEYIGWIQRSKDSDWAQRFSQLKKQFTPTLAVTKHLVDNANRILGAVALNMLGWEALLQFSLHRGFLSPEKFQELCVEHEEFLKGRVIAMAEKVQGMRPHEVFLHHLQELITGQRVIIVRREGGEASHGTWPPVIGSFSRDQLKVRLIPSLTMAEVRDAYRRSVGSEFPYSQDGVGRQLKREGLLQCDAKGTTLSVKHPKAMGIDAPSKAWVLPAELFRFPVESEEGKG